MEEREKLQIAPPPSQLSSVQEVSIPQKHVAKELSKKHTKTEESHLNGSIETNTTLKKERKQNTFISEKYNEKYWIYNTNICENNICFSLQEPQDSICIIKIAIHIEKELPDFLCLQNKCIFERLYTPQMTDYVLYEGYLKLESKIENNHFELEISSFSDDIYIDWEQQTKAPLIQILH